MSSRTLKRKRQDCTCEGAFDPVEPAVLCESCTKWFHFRCIGLNMVDAEDMTRFICPTCSRAKRGTTQMFWEYPCHDSMLHYPNQEEAMSMSEGDPDASYETVYLGALPPKMPRAVYQDSDEDVSSDDNYSEIGEVEEFGSVSSRRGPGRRLNHTSASHSHRATRGAVAKFGERRRRWDTPESIEAEAQRGGDESSVSNDPVRKYCYGKLLEVIRPMFEEHFIGQSVTVNDVSVSGHTSKPPAEELGKAWADQTPESAATEFVDELERRLYDAFAEFDEKKGRSFAAAKYRERFRTLIFNLSQSDRASLRLRIGTRELSAGSLAKMSSADLANEERQHEIEIARRESLQHSILEAPAVPTAKITHKGEEIIEALTTYETPRTEPFPEREQAHSPRSHHRSSSFDFSSSKQISTPGNVPPVAESQKSGYFPPDPLLPEPSPSLPSGAQLAGGAVRSWTADSTVPDIPTNHGIRNLHLDSPGATPGRASMSPLTPSHPNFSLTTLWSGTDSLGAGQASPAGNSEPESGSLMGTLHDEFFESWEDDNLDALLAPEELDSDPSPREEVALSSKAMPARSAVWTGEVIMPMEPSPPLSCKVFARQVGGTRLGENPATWRLLFTAATIRIDGRVPVPNSTQYLLTMRMTANKELVATALFPQSASDVGAFRQLFEFLYSRGRHGIAFPWGAKPSDAALGKDLYLVPLKATEPIPEFVQVLDHVELPVQRSEDILLGIFVLYKARVPRTPRAPVDSHPGFIAANGLPVSWPSFTVPTIISGLSPTPLPPSVSSVTQDIARLTPEQLQLVQTLIEQAGIRHSESGSTLPSIEHGGPAVYQPGPQTDSRGPPATYGEAGMPASGARSHEMAYSPPNAEWGPSNAFVNPPMGGRPYSQTRDANPEQQRSEPRDSRRSRPYDRPRDSGWSSRRRGHGH